jgi:hypothetical protein
MKSMISCLRLARLQLDRDLLAQVDRQVGMGRRDGLVLAHQATQFLGDRQHSGLKLRVGGAGHGLLGTGPGGNSQQTGKPAGSATPDGTEKIRHRVSLPAG